MPAAHPAYQCVVISPSGKVIECQTVSVILPAHDGEIGILRNHVPLLVALDLGIMKITTVPEDVDTPGQVIPILVDGGFALLAANNLTVTAFDAVWSKDLNEEKLNRLIEKNEKLAASATGSQQKLHLNKKVSLLRQFSDIKDKAAIPA